MSHTISDFNSYYNCAFFLPNIATYTQIYTELHSMKILHMSMMNHESFVFHTAYTSFKEEPEYDWKLE